MSNSNVAVENEAFQAVTELRESQYRLIKESLDQEQNTMHMQKTKTGILLPENAARLTMEGYDVVVVINGELEECRYIISWFLAEKDRIGKCVVHAYEPFIKEQYEKKMAHVTANSLVPGGELSDKVIE
jgi:uncharacterized protein (DUF608 family)